MVRAPSLGGGLDGMVARIAATAATAGRTVQLVGKVGDDDHGDQLLLALAEAGVGHVALLRDPTHRTPVVVADADDEITDANESEPAGPTIEPADTADRPSLEPEDVELALRYLTDFRVIVVAEPGRPDLVDVAAAAAGYGEAGLIVLVAHGSDGPAGATVIEAPPTDEDGDFATLVAALAADLDAGAAPAHGIAGEAARLGWSRSVEAGD
jgi:hypothetical protein